MGRLRCSPSSMPWSEGHRNSHPAIYNRSRTGRYGERFLSGLREVGQIMLRSSPVWNAALSGLSWMTFEDAVECRSNPAELRNGGQLGSLERDLAPRMLADIFRPLLPCCDQSHADRRGSGYPLDGWLVLSGKTCADALAPKSFTCLRPLNATAPEGLKRRFV